MTPNEYLDAAKKTLNISSDNELSKRLGISRFRVSGYRNAREWPDNFVIFRLAVILEKDPAELVADLASQHEKDPERAGFFRDFVARAGGKVKQVAGTVASIFIGAMLAAVVATGSLPVDRVLRAITHNLQLRKPMRFTM